jgi:hypothetical protein
MSRMLCFDVAVKSTWHLDGDGDRGRIGTRILARILQLRH